MEEEKIIFCKSGGCTAKLGAGVLEHITFQAFKRGIESVCASVLSGANLDDAGILWRFVH